MCEIPDEHVMLEDYSCWHVRYLCRWSGPIPVLACDGEACSDASVEEAEVISDSAYVVAVTGQEAINKTTAAVMSMRYVGEDGMNRPLSFELLGLARVSPVHFICPGVPTDEELIVSDADES